LLLLVQYQTSIETARDVTAGHIQNIHQAFHGLASMYTATAVKYNMTWPFVTMPVFEVHGSHAREQSGVEVFAFAPIVQQSQREEWLEYSWNHQGWIEQGREINVGQKNALNPNGAQIYENTEFTDDQISTDLYRGTGGVSDDQGPHVPIWQFSPPPFNAKFVNWNLKDALWMDEMLPAISVAKGMCCVLIWQYIACGKNALECPTILPFISVLINPTLPNHPSHHVSPPSFAV